MGVSAGDDVAAASLAGCLVGLPPLCYVALPRCAPIDALPAITFLPALCVVVVLLHVGSVLLLAAVRVLGQCVSACSTPASPRLRVCALHLLCRDAGFCMMPGDGAACCLYARRC